MTNLSTIREIKEAVDAGKAVFADNSAYMVIKDSLGQYMILCTLNNHCVGLHGRGIYSNTLNGTDFYTIN